MKGWSLGQMVGVDTIEVRLVEELQSDGAGRTVVYGVQDSQSQPGLLWLGEASWAARIQVALDGSEDARPPGLPHVQACHIDGDRGMLLLSGPPPGSKPFDIWAWRHLEHIDAVRALQRLSQAVGWLHQRGGWLQGIQRDDLFMDPATGTLHLVGMVRAAEFEPQSVEAAWRDIRIFGELAYENFLGHEYPGGHQLVALLQDRQAMIDTGLTAPGLSQVLAGTVTPYGDLAYSSAKSLWQGLENLSHELEQPLVLRVGSASTLGNYIFRQNNQDSCGHALVNSICGSRKVRVGFFCVADGIGGIQDGERASGLAVETACGAFARAWGHYGGAAMERAPVPFARGIAKVTCQRLALEGEFEPSSNRGGTTFTGLLIAGNRAGVCHIGDSRAVLVRDGEIIALTKDHTLATILVRLGELTPEEAEASDTSQRTISRFMSTAVEVECDRIDGFQAELAEQLGQTHNHLNTVGIAVKPNDIFILTSDGAHGEVDHATLRQLIRLYPKLPQKLCDAIVEHALARIGRDNSTVMAVLVEPTSPTR